MTKTEIYTHKQWLPSSTSSIANIYERLQGEEGTKTYINEEEYHTKVIRLLSFLSKTGDKPPFHAVNSHPIGGPIVAAQHRHVGPRRNIVRRPKPAKTPPHFQAQQTHPLPPKILKIKKKNSINMIPLNEFQPIYINTSSKKEVKKGWITGRNREQREMGGWCRKPLERPAAAVCTLPARTSPSSALPLPLDGEKWSPFDVLGR